MNESRDNKLYPDELSKWGKLKKDWTLREIVLKEPISSSESEKMKTLRWEVDYSLKYTKENLDNLLFKFLVDSIKNAKDAGIDVSDVETQMPELQKKVLQKILHESVDFALSGRQEQFFKWSYNNILNYLNAAKAAGIDVSDVETQLPEIEAKLLRKEVDANLAEINKYLIQFPRGSFDVYLKKSLLESSYDTLLNNLKTTKDAGVDVSDLEAQMPELQKKVLRHNVDMALLGIKRNVSWSSYNPLLDDIKTAKDAGVDVSDVETQMPELQKKALRYKVDISFEMTKKTLQKSFSYVLLDDIKTAKDSGVDVSDLEAQLSKLLNRLH